MSKLRWVPAHHSPDLFHVQQEVPKATSLNLARAVKQSEAAVAQTQADWQAAREARAVFERQPRRPPGRPPNFAACTQAALGAWVQAEDEQKQALQRQTDARKCVQELSVLYHSYALPTGRIPSVAQVAGRFRACGHGCTRSRASRARERTEKAKRVTTQLLATLTFFFATLQAKVEALNLPPALELALIEHLIPAIYWAIVPVSPWASPPQRP